MINFSIVFGTNLSGGVRTGVMLYYLKYYFNKPEFMSVVGGVGLIATIAGAVLSSIVCKKIGLKATMIWSQVLSLLTCALAFFAPATGVGLIFFLIVSLAGTFFSGLFNPMQGTLLPTAIDYAEWKYHVNANGFLGAVNGFTQTLAGAISGALVAGLLGVFGYVPDVAQTGTAIFGLRLLVSIVPAILQIFMFAVIWFDFTEEKQRQMTAELNERRKTAMVESQS
jgi:Na+/melibiose symporter-like transporter